MTEMRGPAFWTVPEDGAELVHFILMKNLSEDIYGLTEVWRKAV